MASKVHEIAFKIAGEMASNFSSTFKAANAAVKGFGQNLNEMNAKAAQIDKVIRLRQETLLASQSFTKAKQSVQELAGKFNDSQQKTARLREEFLKSKAETEKLQNVIKGTKNPTEELTRAFENSRLKTDMLGRSLNDAEQETKQLGAELEKERNAVSKASNELDKKKTALNEVERAAGTTGQSLQELKKRQDQLTESAEKARIAQEKMAKATELQQKFKGMASAGAMGLASTAAAAAPAVLTVKAAMDFEDMRAELGKYSDDAANIFKGIENLTGKYSKSAADMTAMATNAMQSGIAKTKDEVLTLVESQTQAAVAFGMTGDAVGSAWADIQAKMGTSVAETKAVFDIVNKLGNETSASSEDILNVLQRQGGTVTSLTALNEKQVAAMAGAFRSASNSSEVAATSMGTFFSRLTVGSTATKAQQEAFEALGLDAEDMAKRMTRSSESAQNAVQDVFSRINKLSPDKRGAVIGQLFGNEAGIKAAVATLSKNADMLGNNLKVSGDKASYTGSMLNEYAARANTTSEYMGILRNQVTLISARIGQAMLPAVKSITQSLIGVGQKVADFVGKNQGLVTTVSKVIAVLLACKLAFHGIQLVVGLIGQPIMALYRAYLFVASGALKAKVAMVAQKVAMVASKAAMMASAVATKVAAAAQWLLNTAILGCPIMWIIAGIAAVIAIGVLLYKNWDKIKAKTIELWQSFQQKFPMMSRIVQIAMVPIKIAIQAVIIVFKLLKAAGIALWNGLKWCWNGIKSATVTAWNAIKQPLLNAWEKFKQFAAYVKSKFVSAFQGFRDKVSSIFSGLVGIIKAPMNSVISLVNKAIGAINKINVKIPKWAGGGSIGFNIAKIPQLAEGGIATKPTMAMIGEGKESEAVLPLSKLKGMIGGGNGGDTITVNFAPVINVSGGSGDIAGDVQRGLQAGVKDLEKALAQIQSKKRRVSFA